MMFKFEKNAMKKLFAKALALFAVLQHTFTSLHLVKALIPFSTTFRKNQNLIEGTLWSSKIKASEEFYDEELQEGLMKISSPLKFIGPYLSLSLNFPNLATSSQRERDVSGISLDFVLDTAANTNTINAQVATELNLEQDGSALPGFNAAGPMDGGTTFVLGDCSLDLPEKDIFMTQLTASALPVASPAAAGLLGVAFLNCFQGGVKFDWGKGKDAKVTFYGEKNDMDGDIATMQRAPIEVIKDILLPSVILKINGKEIRALLDTGSPITVVNSAAAKFAGLDVIEIPKVEENQSKVGFGNPFKKIMDNVKVANSVASAAANGDLLMIAGAEGQAVQLLKTTKTATLSIKGDNEIVFPDNMIYVGDLPGLAALDGLNGSSSPPAAVLGMDILRTKPSMLYRADELYF